MTNQDSSLSFLDPSDPLFLHPADHPGLLLVSKPFDGSNFGSWKKSMSIALSAKNKLLFISPNSQPNPTDLKYHQWKRCSDMVTSWILNVLSHDIADSVLYSNSAHDIWKDLDDSYGQANGAKLFQLEKDIRLSGQGTNDIAGYFTKLKKNWDELSTLSSLPICSCGAAQALQKFNDDQRLIQFLMGLNSDYNHIRGNILMMTPLPSISQAYALLSQEEKQREVHASSHFITESASMNATNHIQVHPQFQQHNQSQKQKFDGKRFICTHCKKPGHLASKCYRLVGFPKDFRFTKNKKFSGNVVYQQVNDVPPSAETFINTCTSCNNDNGNQNTSPDFQSWNSNNHPQNISQAQFHQLMTMMSNLQTNSKPNTLPGDNNTLSYSGGNNGQAFTAANFSGITAFSFHSFSGNCTSYNGWSAADYT